MKNYFIRNLLGSNKIFFGLLGLLILLVIVSGLLSPIIEKNLYENWKEEVKNKVDNIEFKVDDKFIELQHTLIAKLEDLKSNIRTACNDISEKQIIRILNNQSNGSFQSSVFSESGELVGWTDNSPFEIKEAANTFYDWGETRFYRGDLITFLAVSDTIQCRNEKLLISLGLPIEKQYALNLSNYEQISFTNDLSLKFNTAFEIDYSRTADKQKDGRKYSFPLLNNYHNKIGIISFYKPYRDAELQKVKDTFSLIQSLLILTAFLLIGLGGYFELRNVSNNLIKLLSASVYLIILRYLLLQFNIPERFLSGALVDPSYFSSTFGFGIVKSPIEFFITLVLFFLIVFKAFSYTRDIYFSATRQSNAILSFGITLIIAFIYLLSLRGFEASIRSVIFDSKFLYFDDPELIPNLPAAFMHLNVLILGCLSIVASQIFLLFTFKYFPKKAGRTEWKYLILFFILYQFAGLLFDSVQRQPQGTTEIRIIYITFSFILFYFIPGFRRTLNSFFISCAFTSAVVTSLLLNYYNFELERESLKVSAYELTKSKTNWLDYQMRDALERSSKRREAIAAFTDPDANLEAKAFIIWGKSGLSENTIKSEVNFLDIHKNYLGGFSFNYDENSRFDWTQEDYENGVNVEPVTSSSSDIMFMNGIAPVYSENLIVGYIAISFEYGLEILNSRNIFPFFINEELKISRVIKTEKLKFFDFRNNKLLRSYGSGPLNEEESDQILSAKFPAVNEAWINMKINDEDHLVYALKIKGSPDNRLFAAAMMEKDLSFSLFDFFKSFFIQSIFVIIFLILVFAIEAGKRRKFSLTFRLRLLLAFLFISIVPLILLAIYFRGLTDSKNQAAILYKLNKRAESVVEYVNTYLYDSDVDQDTLFKRAAEDLNVEFSLYEGTEFRFSSVSELFNISLLPNNLRPEVYLALYDSQLPAIILRESIEGYSFNSYYKNVLIGDDPFVINIADVFNPISIPMSETQLDIFLFGSYSLAVVLIIMFSSIFSNQISLPIRKLTQATRSVAGGDLSLKLNENYKGEIDELVSGFNKMILDLKRSQSLLADMERETAWKEMAKQVAHEIKNPLTPMKLSIQQLIAAKKDRSPKFDEIFNQVSATLIDQIETLKNIASEFSNFARMPAPNFQVVDAVPILHEAVNLFSDETAQVNFESSVLSASISADADRLKRTLINLIRNSIQAGASKVTVKIESFEDDFYIRVVDNGRGIPVDIISKIFDEDFTTKEEGMGLGLNLARKAIEGMHGSISVEESTKGGTTILIILHAVNNA